MNLFEFEGNNINLGKDINQRLLTVSGLEGLLNIELDFEESEKIIWPRNNGII